MRLSVLAAVADSGVIGRDNALPWHLPADLRRFKELTMGHPVIMGRLTYESIGRPLPGRRNLVLSRSPGLAIEGVEVLGSLELALEAVAEAAEAFVIGGAGLFAEALRHADRLYLTRVHARVDGDTHFPEVDTSRWQLVASEPHAADAANPLPFTFEVWDRSSAD